MHSQNSCLKLTPAPICMLNVNHHWIHRFDSCDYTHSAIFFESSIHDEFEFAENNTRPPLVMFILASDSGGAHTKHQNLLGFPILTPRKIPNMLKTVIWDEIHLNIFEHKMSWKEISFYHNGVFHIERVYGQVGSLLEFMERCHHMTQLFSWLLGINDKLTRKVELKSSVFYCLLLKVNYLQPSF